MAKRITKIERGMLYSWNPVQKSWMPQRAVPKGTADGFFSGGESVDNASTDAEIKRASKVSIPEPEVPRPYVPREGNRRANEAISRSGQALLGAAKGIAESTYPELAELRKGVGTYSQDAKRYSALVGEQEAATKALGTGVEALRSNAQEALKGTSEALATAKGQNVALDAMKAQGLKSKLEMDAMHQANLAQQAKWEADAVQSRVDAVAAQARHPWEPKGMKDAVVKTQADVIGAMDKEIDAMARKPIVKSAVALKPRPALEMPPASMAETRQERPTNYAQEYKKRYAEALAGSQPTTGGLM